VVAVELLKGVLSPEPACGEDPDLPETIPSQSERGECQKEYACTCEDQDHDGVFRLAGMNLYAKEETQDSVNEHCQKEQFEYQYGDDNGKPDPRAA